MKCENLQQVRDNINRIDDQIIKLIAERGEYVAQAAKFKSSADGVKDTARVESVIKGVREKAEIYGADPDMAEVLYRVMISRFVKSELDDFERIKNNGTVKIKFCGMRRALDIEYANECKPDYVGFILSDGFKRSISYEDFLALEKGLDKGIKKVGVFVNERPSIVEKFAEHLDVIQLHGDEDHSTAFYYSNKTNCEIWKVVRAKSPEDIEREQRKHCDKLLIDSFSEECVGGTGKRINTEIVKNAKIDKPFFIAGGITAENIAEIVRDTKPYGVDVSSGTETDGFKDLQKMKNIMRILREDI